MILLLRCPNCRNTMKYSPKGSIEKKSKRCVYCGKTFSVKGNVVQREG